MHHYRNVLGGNNQFDKPDFVDSPWEALSFLRNGCRGGGVDGRKIERKGRRREKGGETVVGMQT